MAHNLTLVAPAVAPILLNAIAEWSAIDLALNRAPREWIAAAKAELPGYDKYMRPAPPEAIEIFLIDLREACIPIADEEFEGRVRAVKLACGSFAAWGWSRDVLASLMLRFPMFPPVADIGKAVWEKVATDTWRLSSIRRLAHAKEIQEPAPFTYVPKVVTISSGLGQRFRLPNPERLRDEMSSTPVPETPAGFESLADQCRKRVLAERKHGDGKSEGPGKRRGAGHQKAGGSNARHSDRT